MFWIYVIKPMINIADLEKYSANKLRHRGAPNRAYFFLLCASTSSINGQDINVRPVLLFNARLSVNARPCVRAFRQAP